MCESNLLSGIAATPVGLAAVPADSGTLLCNALNGVLCSLPGLAFIRVRKGSYPIAPQNGLPAS